MNILFVSHAANRSGAPLVLLELLRYLKRETAHHATILCLRDGPLRDEFARVATVLEPSAPFVRASQIAAARRRLNEELGPIGQLDGAAWALERLNRRQSRAKARHLAEFDLIYLNSVASGDVLPSLEPMLRAAPLLSHVHELEWAIDGLGSAWNEVKKRSDAFVAASEAVKIHLVEARGVAHQKIETVHEFLDFESLRTDREAARIELRARLRLPAEAFLVGGCGTMEWRKGADWWAQLAAQICDSRLHFVWLGGQKNAFSRQVEFDLKKSGLEKRVHFLPPTARTAPFFAGLDAFALTSREDPFPLVALEAAAQSVPVLCFERAGGAVELVGADAGFIAPYGDLAAMARALQTWRGDEDLRRALGETAARKARAMSDVRVGAPKIAALMERTVSGAMRASQPRERQGV